MNRAFVSEQDGWNFCLERQRECRDASLRGECEREHCRYPEEKPEKKENGR